MDIAVNHGRRKTVQRLVENAKKSNKPIDPKFIKDDTSYEFAKFFKHSNLISDFILKFV